jgi:hypothetical protein
MIKRIFEVTIKWWSNFNLFNNNNNNNEDKNNDNNYLILQTTDRDSAYKKS